MSNHTPGEWTVSKNLAGDTVVAGTNHHDNDGYIICQTFGRHKYGNAALIAAAPELLAALQAIMDDPDAVDHILHLDAVAADAAIAKATGEVKEDNT